jgi:2-keto-4-pentenoate hydratase/2-oxohepta-3-ene-1,7-dioic acid hydratase in catechol pathway
MALWARIQQDGAVRFGTVQGDDVHLHEGDLFEQTRSTGEVVPLSAVRLLTPVVPGKLIGLVNNFRAGVEKAGTPVPGEPLYFVKAPTSYLAPGEPIRLPPAEVGKVIYEGELGVVIGRHARAVTESEADRYVFGYTCVNDVTALDLIGRDPTYPQWTRAKSFDTFGPFGPFVATGLDLTGLNVRTFVKGKLRQEYSLRDMIFSPRTLVSLLSHDMTLLPGDVIACGTSLGIGVLRPGSEVEVVIEGIGALRNPVEGPGGAA